MSHITSISAIDNKEAIWNYNPTLSTNRVQGSKDAVAMVQTLAVKVCPLRSQPQQLSTLKFQIQLSGQQIEWFNDLQKKTGVDTPLKIPLHNNTCWGSAHKMLDCALKLQMVSYLLIIQ